MLSYEERGVWRIWGGLELLAVVLMLVFDGWGPVGFWTIQTIVILSGAFAFYGVRNDARRRRGAREAKDGRVPSRARAGPPP